MVNRVARIGTNSTTCDYFRAITLGEICDQLSFALIAKKTADENRTRQILTSPARTRRDGYKVSELSTGEHWVSSPVESSSQRHEALQIS